ncbi:thioesterase II family protein [Actinacidiphila acididurans]|uniref:Alpha/beta fold hydrolase n=1 Tax=Actinacidiphila acididurans TaxID=2784346 RepID=A0ABS2TU13_9ACTN|nr:alpha/beta fold hydrolase [Actinacidiphila acididurans]MBM9506838.1 alpha/beta fold hydrolase [Actinacidiphila acididurans]
MTDAPAPDGVPRVTVLFPGAGSFGREFQPLTAALGRAAWTVRYPGRYGRDFGVPAPSFDAVVRSCAEQIGRRNHERPVLCGHSYGAYVAYATAARLARAGTSVAALVVSGARAPELLEVPEKAAASHADAAVYLDDVDPVALADAPSDEWREILVDTTLQDLRLLAGFAPPPPGPLTCPVLALRGTSDPLTSDLALTPWRDVTSGPFTQRTFPGGHTDVLHSPPCTTWLSGALGELP